ncbi:MAG TPA: ankyrin repeat domain-containing protein [Planctomycetota bacterium]|jgi:hypothetical protein
MVQVLLKLLLEIHVNLLLLLRIKSVNELLAQAIDHDDASLLAVLVPKPVVSSKLDGVLEAAIRKRKRRTFKFAAGFMGEEKFRTSRCGEGHLSALLVSTEGTELIPLLAELGFDLSAPGADGKSLAMLALEEGRTHIFRCIVDAIKKQDHEAWESGKKPKGQSALDVPQRDQLPILGAAIQRHCVEEVKILLDAGASPNRPVEDLSKLGRIERMRKTKEIRKDFLQMAIEAQNTPIVEALLQAGANLTPDGVCLLEIALSCADMNVAKLLARKLGPQVVSNARDTMGNSMFNRAILNGNLQMAEFFMGWPNANIREPNFKNVTPIGEAGGAGRIDIVEMLMKAGVSLNEPINPLRQTILHRAVLDNNVPVVEWALKQPDFDLNIADNEGRTALDLAILARNVSMIERIVDNERADIDAGALKAGQPPVLHPPVYRQPPLQLAVQKMLEAIELSEMTKMTDVAVLLVDLDVNVNAQDSCGSTPLHFIARELNATKAQFGAKADRLPNLQRLVKSMVGKKVNPQIRDVEGHSALDVAGQGLWDLKGLLGLYNSGDSKTTLQGAEHAQSGQSPQA